MRARMFDKMEQPKGVFGPAFHEVFRKRTEENDAYYAEVLYTFFLGLPF